MLADSQGRLVFATVQALSNASGRLRKVERLRSNYREESTLELARQAT